ncbi:MAG TPA: thiamine pyrophosphate-binding protein [Vicinamibacteria bacterium]
MKGSEAAVLTLKQLGVEVIFGLCGDTTLPLYEALHDLDHGMRHVLTRDERSASFMADAYARLGGKAGVCEAPSGGGATYILPGVAEANGSSAPLVCITSDIDQKDRGRGTLTELDQTGLFRPVTRWTHMPAVASEIPRALRRAFRTATSGAMGAVHVGLSFDVQVGDAGSDPIASDELASRYPRNRVGPDPDDVRKAARILAEARRPLILAGAGVVRSEAWDAITELAHRLGSPVATSISGKGSIAETDPYALGVVGANGGLRYRHDILRRADVLLVVGCSLGSVTTEKWTLPERGKTRILQLDVNPDRLGHNYEVEVGIVADARRGVEALLQELGRSLSGSAGKIDPEEIEKGRRAHLESVSEFHSSETPIRPERFLTELLPRLPEGAVTCVDPGTGCPYLSAYYRLPRAGRWFVSPRAHGALGYALPAVVGAYFARPDASRVLGIMGDGSFGISCGELETLVRLRLPLTLVVLNNSGYGWIKAGQKVRGGKYYSVDFSDSDHAAIARAFGLGARRVERPDELAPAIEESLSFKGPFLLDVVVQPLHEARAPVSKWIA